jgi:hypothetical protein
MKEGSYDSGNEQLYLSARGMLNFRNELEEIVPKTA